MVLYVLKNKAYVSTFKGINSVHVEHTSAPRANTQTQTSTHFFRISKNSKCWRKWQSCTSLHIRLFSHTVFVPDKTRISRTVNEFGKSCVKSGSRYAYTYVTEFCCFSNRRQACNNPGCSISTKYPPYSARPPSPGVFCQETRRDGFQNSGGEL